MTEHTTFSTLDAYQAAFLSLRGHTPTLKGQITGKVSFHFTASDRLYQNLREYTDGASINAFQFATEIKALRSKIFTIKENQREYDNRPISRP